MTPGPPGPPDPPEPSKPVEPVAVGDGWSEVADDITLEGLADPDDPVPSASNEATAVDELGAAPAADADDVA